MKLYNDINKKMQFNRFMNNLEKDFPLIKFVVSNDANDYDQDEGPSSIINKNVPQLEDCAICQE